MEKNGLYHSMIGIASLVVLGLVLTKAKDYDTKVYDHKSNNLNSMQTAIVGGSAIQDLDVIVNDLIDGGAGNNFPSDNLIRAIIQVESGWDATAVGDREVQGGPAHGYMQMLESTAQGLERRHPELVRLRMQRGMTLQQALHDDERDDIRRNVGVVYAITYLRELMDLYQNRDLAIAAYNSGRVAPRNAKTQEMLNDLSNEIGLLTPLVLDGGIGPLTNQATILFQEYWNETYPSRPITVDGGPGSQTRGPLREEWERLHPGEANPVGRIPQNGRTEFYVDNVINGL